MKEVLDLVSQLFLMFLMLLMLLFWSHFLLVWISMCMKFISCAAPPDVARFFFGEPDSRLRDNLLIMRCGDGGWFAVLVNVASSSSSCGIGPVTLVAYRSLADNLAIGVWGSIRGNVGRAYEIIMSFANSRAGEIETYRHGHEKRWPYWF